MEDVSARPLSLEENVTAVCQQPLASEAQDVSHVTVTIKDPRTCSVTRRLGSVCATLISQHLADNVMNANQASGTSPTADNVNVMVMLRPVTQRLECVSTAETTPWESSVTSVKWVTMVRRSLEMLRCPAENASVLAQEEVDTAMQKHVTLMIRPCSLSVIVRMDMEETGMIVENVRSNFWDM